VIRSNTGRACLALFAAGALALGLSACGGDDDDSGAGDTAGTAAEGGGKIALLLPEVKTARYETHDRPNFEKKVAELCPDCEIIYSNADQDAAKQQQQAEAALTNGAQVLVLDAVDAAAAGATVARAKAQGVPVISYDRLITDADIDYYISFDNETVGKLQGQALVDKLKQDGKGNGTITMINGSPTDNNATLFKKGAHSVIDGSGLKVGAEYDTPAWSADQAQTEMDQAITKLGKDGFVGAYAANDGTAGGAIAAMKSAGIDPSTRPTTGQDAEVAGIQRILSGEQYMTVFKNLIDESKQAAEMAVAVLRGEDIPQETTPVNNGMEDVPSVILTPVAVTKDNVQKEIIDSGFWPADQICTGPYAQACTQAGIQ
jgi:D-xylose transport system substrate-binding protein